MHGLRNFTKLHRAATVAVDSCSRDDGMSQGSKTTPDEHPYLLVFEGGSTTLVSLPEVGFVIVGSADTAGVRLRDDHVASEHLRITLEAGGAVLDVVNRAERPLVNGAHVDVPHALCSRDVITLGDATLGYHQGAVRQAPRTVLPMVDLRRRLTEETERFLRYQRPLALLVVLFDPPSEPSGIDELRRSLARAVRIVDVVGWEGGGELAVVFPETTDQAPIPARRVLDAIVRTCPGARAGLARCPDDGVDPNALLVGARNAARDAAPGTISDLSTSSSGLKAGDKEIVAADPLMKRLFALVQRVASSEIPVLIMGETGAGKEIVAQAVHAWSKRSKKRLVSINCAAFPESLLESELFGHEKGAFSGAIAAKAGLFEVASGGTVFLDEIGECTARTQAELLRVLETKRFSRIGSLHERETDVRVVAATNRPLEDDIVDGRFRQDLYFRLNTATVVVPPLRDRPLDLPVLARMFLAEGCKREGRAPMSISSQAMQRLVLHEWPGNVRELRNLMDYLAATVLESVLDASDLPERIAAKAAPWMLPKTTAPRVTAEVSGPQVSGPAAFRNIYEEIAELESTRIREALEAADGVRVRAAELIGMPLRTMVTKIKVYGLGDTPSRRGRGR